MGVEVGRCSKAEIPELFSLLWVGWTRESRGELLETCCHSGDQAPGASEGVGPGGSGMERSQESAQSRVG